MALSLFKKIIVILVIVSIGWFAISKLTGSKTGETSYQTAKVERGTLVISVTGSGQVSTANNSTITTQASGVVSQVYVKDGDEVKSGDKIAEIDLDLPGQQKAAQSLASYQSAKNSLDSANVGMYTLQSDMFTQWKEYLDLATNSTYQKSDGSPDETNRTLPEFHIANDNWLAAEAKYKNQQKVISQAQTSLNSTWLSYQQSSPTIYAPISGVVSGLSLQPGSVIVTTQSSSSDNSSQSSTKIASIKTKAMPTISINLTEIDIPKIKIGNRVTIKFDAFPDKTYTGKVISIDTAGVTSSGVTNYPTVIRLDTDSESILPNMAASASIITATKDNVLIVPVSSIQTQNGESTVQVMKNGKPVTVSVNTGLSSDLETEITTGLSEGDTIVTSVISTTTQRNSQTTSPFSGFGNRGGTGGNVRVIQRTQ